MDKTESIIQKEIIDYLKKIGALVFRMNSGSTKYNVKLAPKGTPDLLTVLCYPHNKAIWLEVKTEKGDLRDSQISMITELHNRGQEVYVVRSVEDVVKILGE